MVVNPQVILSNITHWYRNVISCMSLYGSHVGLGHTNKRNEVHWWVWASYQMRNIDGCPCAGNAGNVFSRHRLQRKPLVSDPGMHHGTCVTNVPWCMSGSLTLRWRWRRSRHSRRVHNPQFYVFGKRPMGTQIAKTGLAQHSNSLSNVSRTR